MDKSLLKDIKFCSVLKDHPSVYDKSRIYPYIAVDYDNSRIPDEFDGRYVWSMYIEPPSRQRVSSSWALVAKDVLNDRFCLGTAGQLYFFIDYMQILACIDKSPEKKIDGVLSTNSLDDSVVNYNLTEGYSIYDAWEYIYSYGLSNWNCVSRKYMIDKGLKEPDSLTQKDKSYYKDYCEKTSYSCLREEDGKPVARRSYFLDSIFNVEGKDMNERIRNIKYQIAKWGPVAGGFLVYDNFANGYNGIDVYTKAEGKALGGHYVSLVGWGKKDGIEYWICRNTFGSDWGLMGYFYMKMGIEECKLEYNISSVAPTLPNDPRYEKRLLVPDGELYNGQKIYIDNMKVINPSIYKIRESQRYNTDLFYTQKVIDMIKNRELNGLLKPLILYPELLPDMAFYWLMDLTKYDYVNVGGSRFYDDTTSKKNGEDGMKVYFYGLLLGIIAFFIGYRYSLRRLIL